MNLTASGKRAFSIRTATRSKGCNSGRTRAIASSPSSATVEIITVFELACAGVPLISVDHHEAALNHGDCVGLDIRHDGMDVALNGGVDLDHHALDGNAHLVDLNAALPDFKL